MRAVCTIKKKKKKKVPVQLHLGLLDRDALYNLRTADGTQSCVQCQRNIMVPCTCITRLTNQPHNNNILIYQAWGALRRTGVRRGPETDTETNLFSSQVSTALFVYSASRLCGQRRGHFAFRLVLPVFFLLETQTVLCPAKNNYPTLCLDVRALHRPQTVVLGVCGRGLRAGEGVGGGWEGGGLLLGGHRSSVVISGEAGREGLW